MSDEVLGKIKVSIGAITFSGEGTQAWLADQLDKVLEKAGKQTAVVEQESNAGAKIGADSSPKPQSQSAGSLANYLKTKDATSNQVKRFLATACWLSKKGNTTLKTADVSKALKDNHQSKLSNPSDALNKNVGKGFCEKTTDSFFVTPEGWEEIGDAV